MNSHVKKFSEFINEDFSKTIGQLKSDELYKISQETNQDFEEVMREYLEKNLDVKEFLDFFSEDLLDKLTDAVSDLTDYEEPYKNEDGGVDGGAYLKDNLTNFEYDLENDDVYGEFGFSLYADSDSVNIFTFAGELDITETELGQAMVKTYHELYDIAVQSALDNTEASVADAKDLEDTYRHIAYSNGWAY